MWPFKKKQQHHLHFPMQDTVVINGQTYHIGEEGYSFTNELQYMYEIIRLWLIYEHVICKNEEPPYLHEELKQFPFKGIMDDAILDTFVSIFSDSIGNRSAARFFDMVQQIYMTCHPKFIQACEGRCMNSMVRILKNCNEVEASQLFSVFPWLWIIPFYQQFYDRIVVSDKLGSGAAEAAPDVTPKPVPSQMVINGAQHMG